MANDFTPRAVTVSQQIYRALLRAYPRAHREEYGPAMAQLFRDQCREAWKEARGWGLAKLWLRTVPDVVNTSVAEQLAAFNPRKSMTDKMSALFRPLTSPVTAFFTAFLLVFLLVLGTSILITFILPEWYASTARVKLESNSTDGAAVSGARPAYDPYFIQTEFEVIQSQLVLNMVIERLNLKVEWGKRYFNGGTLKTAEVMDILKGRLKLAPERNTAIIRITVYSDDRYEAAKIANAVAESYRDYRVKSREQQMAMGVAALRQQLEVGDEQARQLQAKSEVLLQQLKIASDTVANPSPAEQPYWDQKQRLVREIEDLKQRLARQLEQNNMLAGKLEATQLAARTPKTLVEIIDTAEPGRAPVRPNKPLNILIGAVAGGGLGLVAGAVSALLSAKLGGRGRKPVTTG